MTPFSLTLTSMQTKAQKEGTLKLLNLLDKNVYPGAIVPILGAVRVTDCKKCHRNDRFKDCEHVKEPYFACTSGVVNFVNDFKDFDNPDLKKIFRKHIIRGLLFLLVLVVLIFVLALSFEPQIKAFAEWLTSNFGIFGICFAVFLSDLVISPIPPDAFLFIIGKSQLHSQWIFWVPILGFVSTIAGICGWLIGKKLEHLKIVKRFLVFFGDEHRDSIKRFGFWMVVLGALTPLPFSLTCWLAGIFKLNFKPVLIACLLRVPRFILYYWAIFFSGEIGSLLRNLL